MTTTMAPAVAHAQASTFEHFAENLTLTSPAAQIFVDHPPLHHYIEIKGKAGKSAPKPEPQLERYGPIMANDTLWSIATKVRPDPSVSVYQTILALYHANPLSFEQGNINRLVGGSYLEVPPLQVIKSVSKREAARLVDEATRAGGIVSEKKQDDVNKQLQEKQQKTAELEQKIQEIDQQRQSEVTELTELHQQKQGLLSEQLQGASATVTALREHNVRLEGEVATLTAEVEALRKQLGKEQALQTQLTELIRAQRELERQLMQRELEARQENAFLRFIKSTTGMAMLTGSATLLLFGGLAMWLLRGRREEAATATAAASTVALAPEALPADELKQQAPAPLLDDEAAAENDPLGAELDDELEQALSLDEDVSSVLMLGDDEEEELVEADGEEDLLAGIDLSEELGEKKAETEFEEGSTNLSQDDLSALLGDAEDELSSELAADKPAEEAFEEGSSTLSQDDLSALLESAEDELSQELGAEAPSAADSTVADDDIDALLAEAGVATEPEEDLSATVADEDIDALLAEAGVATEPEEDLSATVADDDIDALLAEAGVATEPEEDLSATVADDDIDALLAEAGGATAPEPAVEPEDDLSATVADDAIDALLAETGGATAPEPVAEPEEDLSATVADDDIDALLAEAGRATAPEPVVEPEEDLSATVADDDIDALLAEAGGATAPEPAAEPEEDLAATVADDDIDALLAEAGGATAPEPAAEPEEDLSATVADDDIDALLAQMGTAPAPSAELTAAAEPAPEIQPAEETDEAEPEYELDDEYVAELLDIDLGFEEEAPQSPDSEADHPLTPDVQAQAEEQQLASEATPSVDEVAELQPQTPPEEAGLLAPDESALASDLDDDDLAALFESGDFGEELSEQAEQELPEEIAPPSAEASSDQETLLGADEWSLEQLESQLEADTTAPEALDSPADEASELELAPVEDDKADLQQNESELELAGLEQLPADAEEEFIEIDQLLEEAEQAPGEPDIEAHPNMDVGLDDYAEILHRGDQVDIDVNSGVSAKLDLARAYMEIDDPEGAKQILEDVLENGDPQQRAEAQELLSNLP